MTTFNEIKKKFQENFKKFIKDQTNLFVTGVDKDTLWNTYLASFPDSERQEFTCNSCRQFIKNYANVVKIVNNKLVSIWSFNAGESMYQRVFDALENLVVSKPVIEVFITDTAKLGTDSNLAILEGNDMIRWQHFYAEIPRTFVTNPKLSLDTERAKFRDAKNVFKRSLEELTPESVDTALELIDQNSLYRGAESKGLLTLFSTCQKEYKALKKSEKDNYCWVKSIEHGSVVSKIRNTAIGTMLIDISEGMDLDKAVARFEKIMAPTNYKRPVAVVSKRMVEQAENTIKELGLEASLGRKLCSPEDVKITNMFFVDRGLKVQESIFDTLKNETVNPKTLSKVEDITLEDFIAKVVPKASQIQVLLENKHIPNLVSLVGPADKESPTLFKWPNNFSWSYKNALADSLKDKVKSAGGKVEGLLRISLEWFNTNDLDLHVLEPDKTHICFHKKISPTGGHLDVDMNAGHSFSRAPVENIIYPYGCKIQEGEYTVYIHNYTRREGISPESRVEIECNGETYEFSCAEIPHQKELMVAKFHYSKKNGIKFTNGPKSSVSSQKVWNLDTYKFHKVSMGMFSPNHWDGNNIGNKHIFFALEGATNQDDNIRGFFNEFLKSDLEGAHKRVFEILANKLKVEKGDNPKQITGVGFSTTTDNSFICKVSGAFDRVLRVKV